MRRSGRAARGCAARVAGDLRSGERGCPEEGGEPRRELRGEGPGEEGGAAHAPFLLKLKFEPERDRRQIVSAD